MKKIIGLTLFLSFLLQAGPLSAQHNKLADTLLVFAIRNQTSMDTMFFRYFMKGQKISWWDNDNIRHQSKIVGFTNEYMMLDTLKVPFDSITKISTMLGNKKGEMNGFVAQMAVAGSFVVDGHQLVMRRLEYEKLLRWREYKNKIILANQNPFPGFPRETKQKNISEDSIKKKFNKAEKSIEWKYYDTDTLPRYYGLKTNLVRDLINEINLTFEYPLGKKFVLDLGAGVLYQSSGDYVDKGLTNVFNQLGSFPGGHYWNLDDLDHSYNNRRGFTIEVTPKFFLFRKRITYMSPQFCYKFFTYHNRWVMADGPNYTTMIYGYQSEKSHALQLHALFGIQTPQYRKFIVDAFFGIGVMYRGGTFTRTKYVIAPNPDPDIDPPLVASVSKVTVSGLVGIKIGYRFGKPKMK